MLKNVALAQIGDDIAGFLVDAAVVGYRDFEMVDPLPAHGRMDENAHLASPIQQRGLGAIPIGGS